MTTYAPVQLLLRLITPRVIAVTCLTSLVYLSILIYAPNYQLLLQLIENDYSLQAKLTIIKSLFFSGLLTQQPLGLVLLLLTALLIGLNFALMGKNYKNTRKNGKAHLAVGGSMVLGFVSTSCAVTCGFSLIPLLGTSLAASFSSFDGIVFRVVTIVLLSASLMYSLREILFSHTYLPEGNVSLKKCNK